MARLKIEISQNYLKDILLYDPMTGDFRWNVDRPGPHGRKGELAGSKQTFGYRKIFVGGKSYYAHRMAWLYMYGEMPSLFIDHINGNKDDNRIENLRIATSAENIHNQKLKPWNTTGATGLIRRKNNRQGFHARITVNGKYHGLGVFDTKDEAAHAYNKAAIALLGDFAVLNPIGEDYESL